MLHLFLVIYISKNKVCFCSVVQEIREWCTQWVTIYHKQNILLLVSAHCLNKFSYDITYDTWLFLDMSIQWLRMFTVYRRQDVNSRLPSWSHIGPTLYHNHLLKTNTNPLNVMQHSISEQFDLQTMMVYQVMYWWCKTRETGCLTVCKCKGCKGKPWPEWLRISMDIRT